MPTPEQLARQNIDALLRQCGWLVESRGEMNLGAARDKVNRDISGCAMNRWKIQPICLIPMSLQPKL